MAVLRSVSVMIVDGGFWQMILLPVIFGADQRSSVDALNSQHLEQKINSTYKRLGLYHIPTYLSV